MESKVLYWVAILIGAIVLFTLLVLPHFNIQIYYQ